MQKYVKQNNKCEITGYKTSEEKFISQNVEELVGKGFEVPYHIYTGFGSWSNLMAAGNLKEMEDEANRLVGIGYSPNTWDTFVIVYKNLNSNYLLYALYMSDLGYVEEEIDVPRMKLIQEKGFETYYSFDI